MRLRGMVTVCPSCSARRYLKMLEGRAVELSGFRKDGDVPRVPVRVAILGILNAH